MKEERVPQAWIGQDVILCRTGTEDWELVTLREVSELGLAYAYKTGEVEGQPVFVPWNSVSWMRPPIPEDLETSETEAE
ncbi:MAG: hypothetical protein LC781_19510 [Actinobacteria bacterium]|nr:hypothetical protein [Actinomycetota bacterium]